MAGKFEGWLLVSDFDDTLRPGGESGTLTPEDREALERFMAGGGRFTVATGRDLCSWLSIRGIVPHNAPAIVSNGALIAEGAGEILWESVLPESKRKDLAAMLAKFPEAGAELHRGQEVYVVRRTPAVEEHLRRMGAPVRETDPAKVPEPWNKIVLLFPGSFSGYSGEAHAAAAWVNEQLRGYTATPSGALTDVVRGGSDKGAGLKVLCELLGIDPGHLAAVGDSWNDLPLLRAARFAFAPAGAAAEVTKEPDVLTLGPCGACLRDAVAWLEAHLPAD